MPPNERWADDQRITICGDDLLEFACGDAIAGAALAEQLRRTSCWQEAVAGMESVTIQFDAATISLDTACARLLQQLATVAPVMNDTKPLLEVPVCYGGAFGPDLDAVCEVLDLRVEELIALHTANECTVEMLGFTPGFAYVSGLPERLNVPRLKAPRQRVEAGSVGIAGGRAGVYALAGPGGWPLIGRTPIPLFDAFASEPFVLHAGMHVRFRAIDALTFHELQRP